MLCLEAFKKSKNILFIIYTSQLGSKQDLSASEQFRVI